MPAGTWDMVQLEIKNKKLHLFSFRTLRLIPHVDVHPFSPYEKLRWRVSRGSDWKHARDGS